MTLGVGTVERRIFFGNGKPDFQFDYNDIVWTWVIYLEWNMMYVVTLYVYVYV